MRNSSKRVTLDEARQALLRSGYLLENRLDTLLRNEGYYVEANTAYPDPDTGKSRELDLYAMSASKAGPDEFDFAFAVLLIECVNNPQPIAFITKEPLLEFLQHHEVKLAGLPVKIPVRGARDSWESLPDYLGMGKYHHYCKGRVATQFCSFVKKKSKDEWMAIHDETHFNSFRKLSATVEHFVDQHFKSWRFGSHESVNIEFYYPIVLVQGELLDVRPSGTSLKAIKADHVQYRQATFVRGRAIDYQVDVVTERFFPRYLELVDRELSKNCRLLRRRHIAVRNAIDKITRTAKRLRSPEKIRAAMEF